MLTRTGRRWMPGRLGVRLVGAILAVSLPLMIGMALVLTAGASLPS